MQNNPNTRAAIELTRLREITTPEGKTVLYGQFGFAGARLQITEMDAPDEFGCTWKVELLSPRKSKQQWPKQSKTPNPKVLSSDGELLAYCSGMVTTGEEA